MFDELENVVLAKDLREYGLKKGDIGTVVHAYKKDKAFEVEFVAASGKTIALITLKAKDLRTMKKHEVLHAREYASA